jgi:chemotaxis protein methyltransferase WspC
MTLSPVEDLVRARIGLDPPSLGTVTFARAVGVRMRARGTDSAAAYAALLAADPVEWQTLLDELVVPESWFFRGGRAYFQHLARWVRERAVSKPVRVLSVPCSTGEEPYSLALALADDGVGPAFVRIEAVDLSPGHVRRAAAARYPAFAFRETGYDPRPAYFREADPGRWVLDPPVRDAVHFRCGNLIDPDFLAGEPPFDLVLCRNLFIYLTADARARAVANLYRLLAPGGLLGLTPAEADELPADRFVPCGPAAMALFSRAGDAATPPPKSGVVRMTPPGPKTGPRSGVVPRPAAPLPPPPPPGSGSTADPPPADPVAAARELANAGRLDSARAVCERAVATGPTADLFSLLGVVHLAAGRVAEAEDAFRRALYLDPDHREALTHMLMVCERRGDAGPVSGFRRRLARLEPETTA